MAKIDETIAELNTLGWIRLQYNEIDIGIRAAIMVKMV